MCLPLTHSMNHLALLFATIMIVVPLFIVHLNFNHFINSIQCVICLSQVVSDLSSCGRVF